MCVWCREGRGTLRIDGVKYDVTPYDYFVVPWDHNIVYSVSGNHLFSVANVHLVPWHAPDIEIEWTVAHREYATHLRGVPWRQDRAIEGLEGLLHFKLSHEHPLVELSDYIIRHWRSANRNRDVLQHCAWVLLAEIHNAANAPPPLPAVIHRMRQYIEAHMDSRIRIDDLAQEIDRTPTHVNGLCQRYLGTSPGRWITHIKLEFACELLRTSRFPVAEVARRSGYEDAFYFSRVFKKQMGVSPLKYRQQSPPI
ncbi:MAG: helix-turn-helix transcriptional regulator [Verrucomicrobia bacterium]|nr:helix-turn-helix transcriptional regulator [Verrucomicrobiota bacterium]